MQALKIATVGCCGFSSIAN